MNTIDKITKIKEKLKVYQETDEYENKGQFDLNLKVMKIQLAFIHMKMNFLYLPVMVGIHISIISM